ncbi:hypothetical protein [Arthrobacter sp. GMC3]|uniref:hypothetical protein n=1 Tax=Arthrobacter sp. GMC3 TaxID=2058894 RepID=UPI000CE36FFE|nr:hypothetical protein [Arthrobacter sp. GMC3]
MTILIEDDGPLIVISFLVICLISITVQILENARQRRKLAVVAGPNQETREKGRLFFYTVLILGLLTLVANYVVGITSSIAATHFGEVKDPIGLFSLPGFNFTLLTLLLYAVAILVISGLFLRSERIELPELLADLHDARKFGALDSPRQIAHYAAELEHLNQTRQAARDRQFTSGDFDSYFTSQESLERPRLRHQIRHLRHHPAHRARNKYFHRRIFLNYGLAAGKWLLPFALISLGSFYFALDELVNPDDAGVDHSLALAWAVAGLVGLLAFASQYRCEVGKVLLKSRKEFISNQTEAECRSILEQATADLPAPTPPVTGSQGSADDDGAEPWLRIGPWEARRRRTKKP